MSNPITSLSVASGKFLENNVVLSNLSAQPLNYRFDNNDHEISLQHVFVIPCFKAPVFFFFVGITNPTKGG